MATMSPADLLTQLRWRYATKQFDASRTIDAATWSALEQSLVLTPSSFGLQPWKFIVVTNSDLKAQLKAASWNQSQVTDCSHHVVFAARTNLAESDITTFISTTATTRNLDPALLDGYKGMMLGALKGGYMNTEWSTKQCYIALGQLMTTCAVLGLDACPMEGFDRAKYDEILGLSAHGLTTAVACPVGYRLASDKYATVAKIRYPTAQLIEHR
jgi:nitroreductase